MKKTCLLLVSCILIPILVTGCSTSAYNKTQVSGLYVDEKNPTAYLIIEKDGTWYSLLHWRGEWYVQGNELILITEFGLEEFEIQQNRLVAKKSLFFGDNCVLVKKGTESNSADEKPEGLDSRLWEKFKSAKGE